MHSKAYQKKVLLCRRYLFIILLFFNLFQVVFACSSSADPVNLGPIVVSAKRTESVAEDYAESVTVLEQDDINSYPAQNLGEILSFIPGVNVYGTNRFGQPTSITIRGSETRQVLLMVDGIPFNTQLSGQANPSLVPIDNVERIEVIKGAASSAWGSSLGGVINVITKEHVDSFQPHGKLTSSFAEFNTSKNILEVSGKTAQIGYYLFGSYLETDGYKSKSEAMEEKLFGKLSHQLNEETKFTGSFGYTGSRVFDIIPSNNQWYDRPYNVRYGQIAFDHRSNRVNLTAAYKYNHQNIGGDTYIAETRTLSSASQNQNLYQGVSLNANIALSDNDYLVAGADFDWHKLKSSNYFSPAKSIQMIAPYVNYTRKIGRLSLIPGIRYDHNEKFGSQTSPSFGVVYNFEDVHHNKLRAKLSRAFNAPPLMWIYNYDPVWWTVPNPDLKAERSMSYEIGHEIKIIPPVAVVTDFYWSEITDAITATWTGAAVQYQNVRKFRRQGVETSLRYQMTDNIDLYITGAFNDSLNLTTKEKVQDTGVARQSFTLGGNYKNQHGFTFNLSGQYFRWASPENAKPNDQKLIVDARVKQGFKDCIKGVDLEIFFNVYNITNSKYWSNFNNPSPPRYFEGGFSVIF